MKYDLDLLVRALEILFVGLAAIVAYLIRHGYKQGQHDAEFSEVKRKVNVLMDSLVRRGSVELAIKRGPQGEEWATFQSPLHLGKMAVEAVLPFIDVFVPFYLDLKQTKPDITENEMVWLFEEKFGDFIVQKICVPNQLSSMGCLVAVVKVCEQIGNSHVPDTAA